MQYDLKHIIDSAISELETKYRESGESAAKNYAKGIVFLAKLTMSSQDSKNLRHEIINFQKEQI